MKVAIIAVTTVLLTLSGCGERTPEPRSGTSTRADSATIPTASEPQPDSVIVALGNEPFWNVRISAGEILYRDPGHQDGFRFSPVAATEEGGSMVFRTRREAPADDTGPRVLELRIRQEACSDGMSDREYTMSARLTIDGETRKGCAYRTAVGQVRTSE